MNLIDALERLKSPIAEDAVPLRVFLACGFTPLHLETFVAAHLRERYPTRRVEVGSGLFGDLVGNLERLQAPEHDALVVVVEWPDLDPRLGVRTLGGWQADRLPDIQAFVARSLKRLTVALRRIPTALPVTLSLPTLSLPPLSYTGDRQSSSFELSLRRSLASFAEIISGSPHISILSELRLNEISPPDKRFDLRNEITNGFPYRTSHAAALGELLAEVIGRPQPKKGLITDLDDTLWAGLLGEVGVEGIHWTLEEHAQLHGLYQQFLASLASAGIMIAAASKNEMAIVEQALERDDLLLSKKSIFPIEANWDQKSLSVRQILKRWNVLPESVVFVDDSPMEVAEVQAAFPTMECLVFPKDDYAAFWTLLGHLRNRFAKTALSEEDSIRLQSIRAAESMREPAEGEGHSLDDFLEQAQGRLTFDLTKSGAEGRAFELVNKTNQFNLNGRRYDVAEWSRLFHEPRRSLITVSYEDKFGKLGRIAVLIGRSEAKKFIAENWVMSCRAFSRRIEFHCLQYVFEKFSADEIVFELQKTDRNGPLLEFFRQLIEEPLEANPRLTKGSFQERAPKMPHHVEEISASE